MNEKFSTETEISRKNQTNLDFRKSDFKSPVESFQDARPHRRTELEARSFKISASGAGVVAHGVKLTPVTQAFPIDIGSELSLSSGPFLLQM